MNNKIFYMLSFQLAHKSTAKKVWKAVEVLNKSSCLIYGRERCSNKMTTNEKHNINWNAYARSIKNQNHQCISFISSSLFTYFLFPTHVVWASEWNLFYAGVFTLFHPFQLPNQIVTCYGRSTFLAESTSGFGMTRRLWWDYRLQQPPWVPY
jgi:hypothetical protein